jgi:cathepsin A (carboxypeptidase C)
MRFFLLAFVLLFIAISAHANRQRWTHKGQTFYGQLGESNVVPGDVCDPDVLSLSGYYNIQGTRDANYFYWFFESRDSPKDDPLIIWLTGGPGCSSQLALMVENGPCTPTEDGLSTTVNPYSWNSNANIMWIDQPAGVGYSYGDLPDYVSDEEGVSEDLYWFLQAFFQEHPEYSENAFFVFGESYGGHYVPATSYRIWQGNNNKEGSHINLSGVGIGNGMTTPTIQYEYYPQMANNNTYGVKAVSDEQYQKMVDRLPTCLNLAEKCQKSTEFCSSAYTYCNMAETTPYYNSGLNPYDVRKECGDNPLCYDFSSTETFLNLDSTRQALGVNNDEVKTWESCNNAVNAMFVDDWMKDFNSPYLSSLLDDGIPVLAYSGDADFICNWMGNKAWTLDLDWSGHDEFNAAGDHPWLSYGMARTAKDFTFLQVYEAGHMVPLDQPQAALEMLNTFTSGKGF